MSSGGYYQIKVYTDRVYTMEELRSDEGGKIVRLEGLPDISQETGNIVNPKPIFVLSPKILLADEITLVENGTYLPALFIPANFTLGVFIDHAQSLSIDLEHMVIKLLA